MLFSVIIPTHNRADLLEQAVESVFGQRVSDYEIIVVDDGSSDGTEALLNRYGNRIKWIRQANAGPGAARNRGIAAASGQYITFLDSDDLWFPWTLQTYERTICKAFLPSFVTGRHVAIRDGAECAQVQEAEFSTDAFADYLASHPEQFSIGTGSVAIKKDVLNSMGGFWTERMNAEDSDLWLRLGVAAGFARIQSPFVFALRRTAGSETSNVVRIYSGLMRLLDHESAGLYPGGHERRVQRLRLITAHVRPGTVTLLRAGQRGAAWRLYKRTFGFHWAEHRFRYLFGFWGLMTLGKR